MNKEIWKPVVGYEVFYEVSNFGRVRSLDRIVKRKKSSYISKGRILKLCLSSTGYHLVNLCVDKKSKTTKVHRIVGFAFLPNIEGKEVINHKDGNPLNNNVENLEWCNQSENVRHAYDNGLIKSGFIKFKKEITKDYLENGMTLSDISKKYKCSAKTISDYLKSNGVNVKKAKHYNNKYNIDKKQLSIDFDKGLKNPFLAKKYNTNRKLIVAYRVMHNKGELIK